MAAPYPSFPASPTIGQSYTDANGAVWVYGNTGWEKKTISLTSDPSIWQDVTTATFGAGTAASPSISFSDDPNTGIYRPGPDQLAISTNGTGRLFVDASGNVGFGQASPTSIASYTILSVNNTAGGAVYFQSSGTLKGRIINTSTDFYIGGASGTPLILEAGGSEKARITSAGTVNIVGAGTAGSTQAISFNGSAPVNSLVVDSSGRCGIGTSSPSYTLDVAGSIRSTGGTTALRLENTSNAGIYQTFSRPNKSYIAALDINNNGGKDFTLYDATAAAARITISDTGAVGIGSTAPTNSLEVAGTATSNLFAVKASSSGDCLGLTARSAGNGAIVSALNSAQSDYEPLEINGEVIYFQTRTGTGTVSERARIDSSGRWLLGTSSAQGNNQLQIQADNVDGGGALFLRLGKDATAINAAGYFLGTLNFGNQQGGVGASIRGESDAAWGGTGSTDNPGRLVFSTTADGASSPTERMRIQQSGSITFGNSTNTSPALNGVAGIVIDTTPKYVGLCRDGDTALGVGRTTNDGSCVRFYRSGTDVGNISVTTTATTYNSGSDYRLKENVTPLAGGTARLKQLKPSQFNFIVEPDIVVDGFIAHEVQEIVPQAVTGEKDEVDDDGNPIYQGIDQSKLVPLLTAALQEAIGEIESLKARVAALESA